MPIHIFSLWYACIYSSVSVRIDGSNSNKIYAFVFIVSKLSWHTLSLHSFPALVGLNANAATDFCYGGARAMPSGGGKGGKNVIN